MINQFRGQHAFLSNFYLTDIIYKSAKYPSVENAFQSAKSNLNKVYFQMCKPAEAKKFGRTVDLIGNWDAVKIDVMYEILKDKFKHGTLMATRLVATGKKKLVEGNTWGDRYWGVCKGTGDNNLGRLLERIRAELNAEIVFDIPDKDIFDFRANKTHWGWAGLGFKITDDTPLAQKGMMTGISGSTKIKQGQYVYVTHAKQDVLWKVEAITYHTNPKDMFDADLIYAGVSK